MVNPNLKQHSNREDGAQEGVRVFNEKLNIGCLECDLLPSDVARYYVMNWKLKLGERGLKVMLNHKPEWYEMMPGPMHRYVSCDWTLGGLPSYKDELKSVKGIAKVEVSLAGVTIQILVSCHLSSGIWLVVRFRRRTLKLHREI